MGLVKLLLYFESVDIFSYSGPSGILGSDRKQNTAEVSARGVRIAPMFSGVELIVQFW